MLLGGAKMFDVFISHSSIDKKGFVEPLVDELNKLGLQVWYDKNSIHKGDKIKDSIINGIAESVVFLAVISKNYYKSNWSSMELGILSAGSFDNFLPLLFSDIKKQTGQKYPFILEHNYIEVGPEKEIKEIALGLKEVIDERKQESGFWHIEKTNLVSLVRELHSYNSIALEQLAIHLNLFWRKIYSNRLAAINEVKLMIKDLLRDVANSENIYISQDAQILETFLDIEFLNLNLKEHLKYLNRFINKFLDVEHAINTLDREEMYLLQFSIYSVVEWYMTTYFKKPILQSKKIIPVRPEEFTENDILESYEIEKLVLPAELIASPSTDKEWFDYNPLTNLGARDTDNGKLIGFFTSLPIGDELYKKIKSGKFDYTTIPVSDIRQYDMPGFYKLYLCSFCIHPAYNTTNAFRIIYSNFIDFLLKLASEHEIFISDIIADGVTQKGSNLCESIGMTKVAKSIHNSDVYEACLIPPSLTTIKLNNRIGQQLLAYYKQMYNNYKEIF